jgi:hypothetical protein
MGLRLGRRDPGTLPWLRNGIVAWSPAGVWDPMVQDEIKRVGPDHCRDKWDEAENNGLPGHSTSRNNYFVETYNGTALDSGGNRVVDTLSLVRDLGVGVGAFLGALLGEVPGAQFGAAVGLLMAPTVAGVLGPMAQVQQWYRDDWVPCNGLTILETLLARYEVYNTFFRQWNWRVAGEQLIYSHVDHIDHEDSNSPFRYQLNRIRTLLASGSKDDFQHTNIFSATRTLASHMSQTPGRSLFLNDTGHSIHTERPLYFASEIVSFLNLSATGRRFVFWEGTDGNLWQAVWNGTAWVGPNGLGMGQLGSPPSAAVDANGATYVFWKGGDANLWTAFWNGTAWDGPHNLGMGPLGSAPSATVP